MLSPNSLEGRALALVERIESLEAQIAEEQERCKEHCAPMREDLKELWQEVRDGDMPRVGAAAADRAGYRQ